MRQLLFIAFAILTAQTVKAQLYTFKLGPALGTQTWNGTDKAPLLRYHGALSVETYTTENNSSVYAQIGYHARGSSTRFRRTFGFLPSGQQVQVNPFNINYVFHNAALVVGMKKKRQLGTSENRAYYHLGLRGEYTFATNLQALGDSTQTNPIFFGLYPLENYVKRVNYGVNIGGGLEFKFSDYYAGNIEFTISPDFSRQYFSPLIPNVYSPYTGTNTSLPEQTVRNVSFELSFGIRMLRVVEYID
jgi:hypothetical protein